MTIRTGNSRASSTWNSPSWVGRYRSSWSAWFAFEKALFGHPMDAAELAIYQECTGRVEAPAAPAREAALICGRRAGKSRIIATTAVYLAAFIDWTPYLAPGERATISVIAADRKQARLDWSQGKVGFAMNRRTKGGPVDHALPVLRASDLEGRVRAVVVGYACHCTTLDHTDNLISGDWAGDAQEALELDNPGAIALITIGCGGDANPEARVSSRPPAVSRPCSATGGGARTCSAPRRRAATAAGRRRRR